MGIAGLFAVGIVAGMLLVAAAFAMTLGGRAAARRQRVLDRFSGERAAPVELRRTERRRISFRVARLDPRTLGQIRREAGAPLLALAGAGAVAAAFALSRALPVPFLLSLGAGAGLAGMGVVVVLRMRRARREAAIAERVPEALEMMVRSLRVGLPVARAIIGAGDEIAGPLGEEFRETAYQVSYGKDIVTALRDLAQRTHNRDLGFLATVVAIQQASGGNLAEVLERLAAITRGRQQMRRKIAAATAEAQWSGRFLSAFPILASGAMLVVSPGFFDEIIDKPFFPRILAVVGVLLVMNILFMRRMLRVE